MKLERNHLPFCPLFVGMRTISIILMTAGLVVLGFGFNELETVGSRVKEFFTGSPSEEAVAMLVGGGIAAVLGLLGLLVSVRIPIKPCDSGPATEPARSPESA